MGLLKVYTKAGWGICWQRGAGPCHKEPPRGQALPALGLGRARGDVSWVPSPTPEPAGRRAGTKQNQVNPCKTATLHAGKGTSENPSPCIFAPPEQTAEVELRFSIQLQDLETQISLRS